MTSQELIDKYLEFFRQRGHAVIPAASLIPENDPTVLFTTAGMHPLVPYLLGNPHPAGKRLVDVQPCFRTSDIDEVGDDTHLTFFEMLGNWSLGDYFKDQAIQYSFEFLTDAKWLGIPLKNLAVTVFVGDANAPRDDESAEIWHSLGVPAQRIAYLGKEDNWWGPSGQTGPCGPDTEMFFWTGDEPAPNKYDPKDKHWVEIWNDVFMQYRKTEEGTYLPTEQKNVDTGMGVERTLVALNGVQSPFATELFSDALTLVRQHARRQDSRAERVIVDHVRAAMMILADPSGLVPANVERGYVLRRLIRRAVRFGHQLGINRQFTFNIADVFIAQLGVRYPWVSQRAGFIREQLKLEEGRFSETLERGMKQLERRLRRSPDGCVLSGDDAFDLFQSYGFPIELTEEVGHERGWLVDRAAFDAALGRHQEKSRTAAAGRFRSGLADTSTETTKLHTATHLLQAALRKVLGQHVEQKGSNITPERLRFDFSHPTKMTDEEIKRVEDSVNEQIRRQLDVTREEMSPQEAKDSGALGFFGHKYTGRVSVYSVGDFSQEICTGPHVGNTAELGRFRILKEEACSAGIRRVKATVKQADESPKNSSAPSLHIPRTT